MISNGGIYFDGTFYSYGCLTSDVFQLKSYFPKDGSIFLRNPSAIELLACVLGLGDYLKSIHLIPDGVDRYIETSESEHWYEPGTFSGKYIKNINLEECNFTNEFFADAFQSNLVIYSSGTSGPPKPIAHPLATLLSQYNYQRTSDKQLVWGLTFEAYRMSGIQVLLNAFTNGQVVVCSNTADSLETRVVSYVNAQVSAISATPSFFRVLTSVPDFQNLNLKQITLGGEIVNQKIIDDLHALFPNSRITHIYASTEIGFGFSVSDMLSGFPRDYFERDFERFKLLNVDGELAVEFKSSKNEPAQDVFLTGDLICITDSRVQFSGRRTNIVNVGGNKVNPEEVEQTISEIDGVIGVHVFGIPSSRLGEILSAEVVTNGNLTAQEVRIRLKGILPPYKIPASVEVVREIKLNSSGKIVRS